VRRGSVCLGISSMAPAGGSQKHANHGQVAPILAALPVSGHDRQRLSKQLALRQAIDAWTLRRRLAAQRKAVQKTPHPGSWRHFVASRAAKRDDRAIQLVQRQERERSDWDLERGS